MNDSGPVVGLWRSERPPQVSRRIALRPARGDGVTEHHPARTAQAASTLVPSTCFHFTQHRKQFRRSDFRDTSLTNRRVYKTKQPAQLAQCLRRSAFFLSLPQNLLCDALEGVAGRRGLFVKPISHPPELAAVGLDQQMKATRIR